MKRVSLKYRLIEARFILKNRDSYPESSIKKAKELLKEHGKL